MLKIFRKIKFRVKKFFVVTGGRRAKLLTRPKGERSSVEEFGGDCCIRG